MAVGLGFLWFSFLQLPFVPNSIQYCEKDQSGHEECSSHNVTAFVLLKIGKFLDDQNGVIVAFATVVLAIFTWRLWVSTNNLWAEAIAEREANERQRIADEAARTVDADRLTQSLAIARKAADAASKQADLAEAAMGGLERPHVFITVSSSIEAREVHGHDEAFTVVGLANFGRFPADITVASAAVNQSGSGPQGGIFNDGFIKVIGPGEKIEGLEVILADGLELTYERDEMTGEPVSATPVYYQNYDTLLEISLIYGGLAHRSNYTTNFVWIWDHAVSGWRPLTRDRT